MYQREELCGRKIFFQVHFSIFLYFLCDSCDDHNTKLQNNFLSWCYLLRNCQLGLVAELITFMVKILPPMEFPPLSSAPLKKTPEEKADEELIFNFLQRQQFT